MIDETTITATESGDYQRLHDFKFDENGTSVLFISALAKSATFFLTSEPEYEGRNGAFVMVDFLDDINIRNFATEVCEELSSTNCTISLAKVDY